MKRGNSLSRANRVIGGISAVLVLAGGLGAYQVGVRAKRLPRFSRGGGFLMAAGTRPGPQPAPPTTTPPPPSSLGPASATAARPAAVLASRAPNRATIAAPAAATANIAPSAAAPPAAQALPPSGTYTYQVRGTETATGFGSRAFPPTATIVAHHDDTGAADQVVLDLTYSSDHTERAIATSGDTGLSFVYEAGQVRFGPVAQTNEGDYRPAMTQVPLPLAAGTSRTGHSQVVDSNGGVERSETWTVATTGQETLTIAGEAVSTWVVRIERNSDPGSGQSVHRVRTYWYDQVRHFWVKYAEQMHGEQHYGGVAFTYDDDLTATLSGFQPLR